MKVAILDDYFHTLPCLDCFKNVVNPDVLARLRPWVA